MPQRCDTLLPIVRRLDEAKLDSYPHLAKLMDCVTSNMEQVEGQKTCGTHNHVTMGLELSPH